ncbi:interferon-induced protein 44-like [Alosa pseudoharengus]|uniref:interferon-induced protein 44-like n=1 Tax=Alosa pseudoharengus TaxID=34774 RepID=UPI003F8C60F8
MKVKLFLKVADSTVHGKHPLLTKQEKMGYLWSKEPPPPEQMMETGWCEINWGTIQNNEMKKNLRKLQLKNPAVEHLRILVIGPVRAGKSSFIQSVKSMFKNRMVNAACTVAAGGCTRYTKKFTTNQFEDERGNILPFVISDVMGLGDSGVHPKDIISALKGHLKEGYTFNPVRPCSEEDTGYNSSPTLNDKVHCLVFVIPLDNFTANNSYADERTPHQGLIKTMQDIQHKACDLRIPQVVILTKVDLACPHVKEDIKHVYRSQTIRQKAQACSDVLEIPISDIFLVKNYHEEKQLNPDMDAVLLFTLRDILNYANDFVENINKPEGAGD